jgi:hypothetical protein
MEAIFDMIIILAALYVSIRIIVALFRKCEGCEYEGICRELRESGREDCCEQYDNIKKQLKRK